MISGILARILSVALLLGAAVAQASGAPPAGGPAAEGQKIFEARCTSCHTIGGGRKVGPDLQDVTARRSREWLVHFISDPEEMFQENNPIAEKLLKAYGNVKMLDLGLSQSQITDLLAFLKSKGAPRRAAASKAGATQTSEKAAESTAEKGSSAAGEMLFTGLVAFKNGGPPCLSCHSAAGIPFPNGGSLGPDLTGAYSKYGAKGMASVLATLPFPVMTPIFHQQKLTFKEQHDLEAFFEAAASSPPPVAMTIKMGLMAEAGLFLLLLLIWGAWRNRLLTVRRSLLREEARGGGRRS